MRSLRAFLIAGLLLMAGLLVGCDKEPERMKGEPTNLKSGETKVKLPGKAKPFDAAR